MYFTFYTLCYFTLLFEGVCGRATNVILAPSAGCKGFARRSVTSVPAPKRSKLWQVRRIPGSSVSIGRSCRNFACWLPKIGLLLGIFHAPRTENAPYGYERFGAPSENPPYGYARKKKKPSTDDGQLFIKVALRSNVLYRFFFATGPPLRLRSRPPDSGFAGVLRRHCRHATHAHLLGFWKLRSLGSSVARFVGRSLSVRRSLGPSVGRSRSVVRSLGRSVAQSLCRAVGRSRGRSVCRSLGPSVGRSRSVVRSLGRSVAWSLGRSGIRSLGRSVAR